jgi:hypothetical protein
MPHSLSDVGNQRPDHLFGIRVPDSFVPFIIAVLELKKSNLTAPP